MLANANKGLMSMEFSQFLKKVREKRGLSIRQLALYANVSNGYISQVERGERGTPSPEVLKKLSGPLSISYEQLLKVAGYLPSEDTDSELTLRDPDPEEQFFLRAGKLSEDGKKKLWDFLDYVEHWEAEHKRKNKK